MSPEIESIITQIERFEPSEQDDNSWALNQLLGSIGVISDREYAIEPMFKLMERFPEADLGSPGPLVHEIEAMPGYESHLLRSLARRPTSLTVWMVNRILNACASQEDRSKWLAQLRQSAASQGASASARQSAQQFLAFQGAT